MLYLDHAATTPLRPAAWDAMQAARDSSGNPSGVHEVSRHAKNALEAAREEAAALIGANRAQEVVFTGGGTEADNLAVVGAALTRGTVAPIVVSAVEHKAVLESAGFVRRLGGAVTVASVDREGLVDPAAVAAAVGPDTVLVSIMLANNETGAVQPLADIVTAVKQANPATLVHTDAVQAFVSEPVDVDAPAVDLLSLAAHKFGGPKGVGLLYVRDGVELEPVLHGGGQEMGRRPGTQNVMGVAGMVAAMRETVADRPGFRKRVAAIRDRFETSLKAEIPSMEINGPRTHRLVQHSHVRLPGIKAETLLIRCDQAGLAAAAGSACQSGAIEPSHVLEAMGMDSLAAAESVRFSFGWSSSPEDGELAAKVVADIAGSLS